MIGPSSELIRLNDKIKLFGISPTEEEKDHILKMWSGLTSSLPKKFNISINFFKDGNTFHGEAILGFLSICVISRQTASDLLGLSLKVKSDVIKKLSKSKPGNGWEGSLQLNAV